MATKSRLPSGEIWEGEIWEITGRVNDHGGKPRDVVFASYESLREGSRSVAEIRVSISHWAEFKSLVADMDFWVRKGLPALIEDQKKRGGITGSHVSTKTGSFLLRMPDASKSDS